MPRHSIIETTNLWSKNPLKLFIKNISVRNLSFMCIIFKYINKYEITSGIFVYLKHVSLNIF